ncbi:MAG: LURP-one-related/scramblase family protein [Haloarculaceae archaeon]
MATESALSNIQLTDDRYTVEQSLVRNKYTATDSTGTVVVRGKQKLFKLKEEFPFEDGNGNDVFTVKAGGILDVAGDYTLTDAATGDAVVVLDHQWTLFVDHWKLRDPDTEGLIAEIKSKNKLVEVLRSVSNLANLLPHKYEITDADGDHVGSIDGRFSLKDRYEITIDDAGDVPREAVVAAAMVVDAIEGN